MKKLFVTFSAITLLVTSCGGSDPAPIKTWSNEISQEMIANFGEVLPYIELNEDYISTSKDFDYYYEQYCYTIKDDNDVDLVSNYGDILKLYGYQERVDEFDNKYYTKETVKHFTIEVFTDYSESSEENKILVYWFAPSTWAEIDAALTNRYGTTIPHPELDTSTLYFYHSTETNQFIFGDLARENHLSSYGDVLVEAGARHNSTTSQYYFSTSDSKEDLAVHFEYSDYSRNRICLLKDYHYEYGYFLKPFSIYQAFFLEYNLNLPSGNFLDNDYVYCGQGYSMDGGVMYVFYQPMDTDLFTGYAERLKSAGFTRDLQYINTYYCHTSAFGNYYLFEAIFTYIAGHGNTLTVTRYVEFEPSDQYASVTKIAKNLELIHNIKFNQNLTSVNNSLLAEGTMEATSLENALNKFTRMVPNYLNLYSESGTESYIYDDYCTFDYNEDYGTGVVVRYMVMVKDDVYSYRVSLFSTLHSFEAAIEEIGQNVELKQVSPTHYSFVYDLSSEIGDENDALFQVIARIIPNYFVPIGVPYYQSGFLTVFYATTNYDVEQNTGTLITFFVNEIPNDGAYYVNVNIETDFAS